GQTRVDNAEPCPTGLWCEGNHEHARSGRERHRANASPGDHQPIWRVEFDVLPFDRSVAEHQRELATRPRVQDGTVPHPADKRLWLDEVVVDEVRLSINVNGMAVGFSGHGRTPRRA